MRIEFGGKVLIPDRTEMECNFELKMHSGVKMFGIKLIKRDAHVDLTMQMIIRERKTA